MKFCTFVVGIVVVLLSMTSGLSCNDSPVKLAQNDFNIILITIDALRADHLSCYGYERNTSPHIDEISEKGILFKNVIAPSSWTVPSMVSLFTSVYPINHGIVHGSISKSQADKPNVISDKLTSLAELLKINGYTTFGVASNLYLDEKFGFARGFDYYTCLPFFPAPIVNETIFSWEDKIKKADKFFLWVHYFDPHNPFHARTPWIDHYTSKALTRELELTKKSWDNLPGLVPMLKKDPAALSNLIALYDSEINFVDFYIEKLIKKFKLDENTLIIITSDHGEEFLEHDNIGHSYNLYNQTLCIPLIIKLPFSAKKELVEEQVTLLDIMPSILNLLNITPPEQALGKISLTKKEASDYIFSELDRNARLKTILTPKWKYIYDYESKTGQLYNFKSDPLESQNLIRKEATVGKQLHEQLFNWVEQAKKYPVTQQNIDLSQEEKEKLRELGYIE